jgi:choline dehydrogenase-like flavoprotein
MTSAGLRADATKVVSMSEIFRNPAKDAIRSWVISEIKATEPTLVLDLWGGGRSADEMTAAGLSVLSVDDGRSFDVSKARVKRALMLKAEAGGYRGEWGSAAKYAAECDAAWLDFMGHLCGDTIRILKQCQHMKKIAVTLMPERMGGVEKLSVETWAEMYRAVIEFYTGMGVQMVRKYRRESGQWVLVLLASKSKKPSTASGRSSEYRARQNAYRDSDAHRAYDAALQRKKMTDPEYRARVNARRRALMADPEYKSRVYAQWRDYLANNPEYRARRNESARKRRLQKIG